MSWRAGLSIGIIANPKHIRANRAYERLVRALRAEDIRYRSTSTTPQREGARQATQLAEWGADVIIVLGGDGTIRSAAPVLAALGLPMMVVPTGTANVLSRHVGIRSRRHAIRTCAYALSELPAHVKAGEQTANRSTLSARTREISIPVNQVDYLRADGQWHRSHFVCMAGIGGDARAVAEHRRAPGLLGYAFGGVRALLAPTFTAHIGDTDPPRSARTWSVMASKVARPAGPIPVFPAADVAGEAFEFLRVGPLTDAPGDRLGEWAGIAEACLQGKPTDDVHMNGWAGTTTTIRLETPAPAQLDGDPIGICRELRISAGEARLRLLAPAP